MGGFVYLKLCKALLHVLPFSSMHRTHETHEIVISVSQESDLYVTLRASCPAPVSVAGIAYAVTHSSRQACSGSVEFVLAKLRIVQPVPFEVGAIVRLLSGGPAMTIVAVDADKQALCNWWHNDVFGEATFPLAALEESAREQLP